MKHTQLGSIPVIVMPATEARQLGVFDTPNDANSAVPNYPQVYGIRHADDDWSLPRSIERSVIVNRYGILLTAQPLPMEVDGSGIGLIELTDAEIDIIQTAMGER
ncbi:MAG: hypothetical protein OEM52_02065 [bacterium]|nr:hypothetical protein [bacterium]